jgi:hypothetical protein
MVVWDLSAAWAASVATQTMVWICPVVALVMVDALVVLLVVRTVSWKIQTTTCVDLGVSSDLQVCSVDAHVVLVAVWVAVVEVEVVWAVVYLVECAECVQAGGGEEL